MDAAQSYDVSQYERPSVTVDTVIFTLREGRLHVLLVQRRHWPYAGMWAIPGGFVQMEESLPLLELSCLAGEVIREVVRSQRDAILLLRALLVQEDKRIANGPWPRELKVFEHHDLLFSQSELFTTVQPRLGERLDCLLCAKFEKLGACLVASLELL